MFMLGNIKDLKHIPMLRHLSKMVHGNTLTSAPITMYTVFVFYKPSAERYAIVFRRNENLFGFSACA